jgi:tetratricopeptide (TPR) repeat protein
MGASIPVLVSAAQEMVSRRVPSAARQYIEQEILDRDPENPIALYLRGQTFEQERRYNEAMRDYQATMLNRQTDAVLCAEIGLRVLSLWKIEPELIGEDVVEKLEEICRRSKDVALAGEMARMYAGRDQKQGALVHFQTVYNSYSKERREIWEEAAVFIVQYLKETEEPDKTLRFVREALAIYPKCKVLVRWERALVLEVGEVQRKKGRLVG